MLAAITPRTRLLILNAPNNPTGWTLRPEEQRAILAHCRSTGTWILADEVYERLYYAPSPKACAPSFLDLAEPDDRLVVVHSFSKSFLMTGWRLGWLVLPPAAVHHVGKLVEFNTSCTSVFTQRAGIAAGNVRAGLPPAATGCAASQAETALTSSGVSWRAMSAMQSDRCARRWPVFQAPSWLLR